MISQDHRILRTSVHGLSDQKMCWAAAEPVWPNDEVSDELEHLAKFTSGQQALYCTMLYAREVDNGGIKQFFNNSSSLYSQNVIEGLYRFGATHLREALQNFFNFLPAGRPASSPSVRKQELASLTEAQRSIIQAHEKIVYQTGGFEETLIPYWTQYIHEHSSEFFLN